MLGYGGYGYGGSNKGFVLLIVLFILLVIIQ
ncbi:sporulation protein YjcZ [Priestia megaterium]